MSSESDSFCPLPWMHVYSETSGQLLTCCSGHNRSLTGSSLLHALNQPLMKELRLAMREGSWHSNCEMCRKRESIGAKSNRTTAIQLMGNWRPWFSEMEADGTVPEPKLLFMDLRFSNLCNFKCRTCDTAGSSAWFEDEKAVREQTALGPMVITEQKVQHARYDLSEVKEQLKSVRRIDFVGGEPLLDRNHIEILTTLIGLGRFDVHLNFITNLSRLSDERHDFMSLWSRFPNLHLTISVDGYGARAEYIRHGTDWPTMINNLEQVRRQLSPKQYSIHFTYSLLNAFHMVDFHRWLIETGFSHSQFVLNMLIEPEYYRADILPASYRERLLKLYEAYQRGFPVENLNMSRHSLQPAINALRSPNLPPERARAALNDFFKVTAILDRRREQNFAQVFPEYKDLANAASNLAFKI